MVLKSLLLARSGHQASGKPARFKPSDRFSSGKIDLSVIFSVIFPEWFETILSGTKTHSKGKDLKYEPHNTYGSAYYELHPGSAYIGDRSGKGTLGSGKNHGY
jgi:hypothetical protein